MVNRKTSDEKLKDIDVKLKQLQAQKQIILKKETERLRKERTRRLIQNGALVEKYLNCDGIAPNDLEELLKKIVLNDYIKKMINPKTINQNAK